MKKGFCLVLLFAVTLGVFGGAKKECLLVSSSPMDYHGSVGAFMNPQLGVTAGYMGEMQISQDYGESWRELYPPIDQSMRFSVEVVSPEFILGTSTFGLDLTRDQGANWEKLLPQFYAHISFPSEMEGWVIGEEQWLRTQDGAQNWISVEAPVPTEEIYGLSAASYDEAFLWDKQGMLHFTSDGGDSWDSIQVSEWMSSKGYRLNTSTAAIRFINRDTGILMVINRNVPYQWLICETHNGGESWQITTLQREKVGRPYISHDLQTLSLYELLDGNSTVTVFSYGESDS